MACSLLDQVFTSTENEAQSIMAQHHKPAGHKPPHAAAQDATETDTFQVPKTMDDGRPSHRSEAQNTVWLQRTYYEETVKVFIHAWDLYVKFYTVFMTFNVTGLILAEHYIINPKQRSPVVVAFVVQNLLTLGTSFGIAMYTKETQKKLSTVAEHLAGFHIQIAEVAKGHPCQDGWANGEDMQTALRVCASFSAGLRLEMLCLRS